MGQICKPELNGQGFYLFIRGTTMLIPMRKYSSLVSEVGSLLTKQLLTSCESTVATPLLWGVERQQAGGQRAD